MLVYYDDGRDDYQSYEAWDNAVDKQLIDIAPKGYGASLDEAVENYKSGLLALSSKLNAFAKLVKEDTRIPVVVNRDGLTSEEIEKNRISFEAWCNRIGYV